MNIKKVLFILSSLSFFFFAPAVFAADVSVVGRVGNPDTTTSGSKVIFKNSESQQVTAETIVDPMGRYAVFLPAGTYDIVVVPPAGSNLKPITKSNQEIKSNTESNVTFPSSNPFSSQIPGNILYAGVGGIILMLLVGIGYFVWKRNR